MPQNSTRDSAANTDGTPNKGVTDQVKQGAQNLTDQTQQAAGQAVQQVQQQTEGMAQSQKDKAAQTISSVAMAVRHTGENLQQQDQGAVGQYAVKTADRVDEFAQYLQQRNVRDLVNEVQVYARRNPAVFLSGSFALGLAAARFLKSSTSSSSGSQGTPRGYTGANYGSGYGGSPMNRSYAQDADFNQSGTYDVTDPQYGREEIQGAPDVQVGYAPGLMGDATQTRSGNGS